MRKFDCVVECPSFLIIVLSSAGSLCALALAYRILVLFSHNDKLFPVRANRRRQIRSEADCYFYTDERSATVIVRQQRGVDEIIAIPGNFEFAANARVGGPPQSYG